MKYVLIGSGNISNTYMQAINEMSGSEVVACISRSGKSPSNYQSIPSFKDLASVHQEFDAVIIATPNGLHCEGIIQAAQMGKHVLTEKPLGIQKAEMDEALKAVSDAGVTLSVAYQRRTAPDNLAIKKMLDDGTLGKVFAADLTAKFYRDQAYYDSGDYRGGYSIDGGGPFMQQACHNLDIYAWFFGLPSQVASMMGTFAHNIEAEDHGAALLRYDDGMIGTVIASTATYPGYSAKLHIHTDRGSVCLTDDVILEWNFNNIPNPKRADFNYQHEGATSATVSDVSGHKRILEDFEHAVRTQSPPLVTGESARLTSELILMIYNSIV